MMKREDCGTLGPRRRLTAASQMINVAENQLPVRSGEVGGISRTCFMYSFCFFFGLIRIFFSTNLSHRYHFRRKEGPKWISQKCGFCRIRGVGIVFDPPNVLNLILLIKVREQFIYFNFFLYSFLNHVSAFLD